MRDESPIERDPTRFNESPIAWFGEMVLAKDRGDFRRATEAQDELARLGWSIHYRVRRPARRGGGR